MSIKTLKYFKNVDFHFRWYVIAILYFIDVNRVLYLITIAFEFIAVALLTYYIIWYYARKDVEWYTRLFIYLAWTLGFEIIILLPVDVYISYINKDPTEIKIMEYIWRFNYWIAFALWNFIFPMLGEYVIAGDFTVKAKLCTSIIQNLIFYSVLGLLGGIALLFLWAKGQFDGDNGSFSGFIIFWMNAYGLILIILFLGFGIVAVPKKYFGMKSFDFRRQFVYWKISRKEEVYQDKKYNLEELAATAIALHEKLDKPKLKEYAKQIIDKCPESFLIKAKEYASTDYLEEWYRWDLKSLVKLNKKMKKGIEDYERTHWSLNESLKEAIWLEDIENSTSKTFESKVGGKFMKYKNYRKLIWYWEKYLKPVLSFVIFIITTIFFYLYYFWRSKYIYMFCIIEYELTI